MPAQAKKFLLAEPMRDCAVQPDRYQDSSGESQTSQTHACSLCFGIGMEIVPGKGARRCSCRSSEQRTKLLEQARIPRRYERCTLENYHPVQNNGMQLQAFNHAFKLVKEYPAVDRGLLMMGTVGVGKTHLSVSILRGLIE